MRTKTLLIAAAALAAGVISSQAQVYSQNIVGYANVPTVNAYDFYLLEVPFNVGASNGVNEIFPVGALPDTSQIETWNVGSQTYMTVTYDGSQGNGIYWYQADGITPLTTLPTLVPGQGFFLYPTDVVTNLFSGTVAVLGGNTNQMQLNNAYNFYLLGSTIPYSGFVTNGAGTAQGINLNGLPDTSQVQTWDVPSQGYITYTYDTSQGNGIYWYLADGITPGPCPNLAVGQGLFVYPVDVYTWNQTLPTGN